MQHRNLSRALAAACLVFGASSLATAAESKYFHVQGAIADVDGFSDTGIAVIGTLGVPLPGVSPYFAVEGEAAFSLVDPSHKVAGIDIDASYFSLGGFAALNYPIDDAWTVRGRVGLVYLDAEASAGSISVSDSDINLSLGGGALYKINDRMSVIGEITLIDDLTHIGAGVQMPLPF